ncbi:hypothetical protein SAMN05443663_102110 [Flavobacterium defluvii]|uniref:Uncharacterized protein n=1 Tax=Flavobacterium defluvii TaxID=370979 RepID=A0A1M5HQA6_9FLAO|nr:hypothetical protein SAMN05443663_102110 [Flavobacterium defluvii]
MERLNFIVKIVCLLILSRERDDEDPIEERTKK